MKKLLVAGIAVVVLVLGAAVPALAIQTQAWEERRIATAAFEAAADAALDASDDAALAAEVLAAARESAEPVLADASAVASAAPGYFNAAVLDPLAAAVAALEETLASEAPDGLAMPDVETPEAIDDLRAGVEPLTTWADTETARAAAVAALAEELAAATVTAVDATRALAETVGAEASGALGAAPLASPESRSAVEAARDAVTTAVEDGGTLAKPVADYAGAVGALRASQQAAAEAAERESSSRGYDEDALLQQLFEKLRDMSGYAPEDCVPAPTGGYYCGGVP